MSRHCIHISRSGMFILLKKNLKTSVISSPLVVAPELSRLIKGAAYFVELGPVPSSSDEALNYILNALLCYANSMRDDKHLMDSFMQKCLKTLEE